MAIARAPLARIPGLVGSMELTPPLHFLLMRLWLPLWSEPLLALRAFSWLCGVLALAAYWPVCRRLAGAQAPLAFFLGCASSPWIHAAQNGRCYALVLLLACVQAGLALRLRERWTAGAAAGYAAAGLAGLFSHHYYHLFHLSLAAGALLDREFRRKRTKSWLLLNTAAWLAWLPAAPFLFDRARLPLYAMVVNEPLTPGLAARLFGALVFDASYAGLALAWLERAAGALVLAFAAAGLWTAYAGRKTEESSAAVFCAVNLALPLAAAAALELLAGRPLLQPRYLIFLTIFLYPLLARAAAARAVRLVLAAGFLAGTGAYFASNAVIDSRLAALAALMRQADRRAPVVHWGALEYVALRTYYLPERSNFLLAAEPADARYARLPGYPALIPPRRLATLPRVVVFDPSRRLFPLRVGVCTGEQLLRISSSAR